MRRVVWLALFACRRLALAPSAPKRRRSRCATATSSCASCPATLRGRPRYGVWLSLLRAPPPLADVRVMACRRRCARRSRPHYVPRVDRQLVHPADVDDAELLAAPERRAAYLAYFFGSKNYAWVKRASLRDTFAKAEPSTNDRDLVCAVLFCLLLRRRAPVCACVQSVVWHLYATMCLFCVHSRSVFWCALSFVVRACVCLSQAKFLFSLLLLCTLGARELLVSSSFSSSFSSSSCFATFFLCFQSFSSGPLLLLLFAFFFCGVVGEQATHNLLFQFYMNYLLFLLLFFF